MNKKYNIKKDDWLVGIAIFLISERGLAYLDVLRSLLDRYGFNILCERSIHEDQRHTLVKWVDSSEQLSAGGPVNGDLPAYFLVVHDVHPMMEHSCSTETPERIDNLRLLTVEAMLTQKANDGRSSQKHLNPLYLSCSTTQAFEYLNKIVPQQVDTIRATAQRYNNEFRTPYPVLADVSKQVCRAKVELVDFHGTEAICKTFRPGRERYLEREVKARELGASLPEVSRLLEVGPHYLVFERYSNRMERILSPRAPFSPHGLLPLWTIERVRAVILHYRRLGYECIDLNPQDLIYDPCQGLKIIDFEFLQPGTDEIESLKGNYAWYDVPSRFKGDLPTSAQHGSYRERWFPYTGLPRTLCLNKLPRPVLTMVRSVALVPLTLGGLRRVSWQHIQRLVRN
ncbi:MAG: hypothetical protein GYB28_00435 [Gammaproteobacteria bacterium]|uniref:hypothetical protein n=1 Tax=Vreelandella venusta TaxID=44935 RepID=UPI00295EF3BE|nr:hypothetical protein [Halomonas venusta]MBR9923447.1 hypothetical protein [Gammaproteobacteria bacterium]MDW0358023.1 hypothetical protein [Halomonas venusta]